MNSGKPLRKNVGRGEDQQMFVLSNRTWVTSSSPKKSADQEGGGEKPSDWLVPLNGSGTFFRSAKKKKTKRKVSCLGRVRRRQNQKPSTPGEEDKKIDTKKPFSSSQY